MRYFKAPFQLIDTAQFECLWSRFSQPRRIGAHMIQQAKIIPSLIATSTVCCSSIALASDVEGASTTCVSAATQTSITSSGFRLISRGTMLFMFAPGSLTSIDASDPENLIVLDVVTNSNINPSFVAVDGDLACTVPRLPFGGSIQLIDISDPTQMSAAGSFSLDSLGYDFVDNNGIAVQDDTVYLVFRGFNFDPPNSPDTQRILILDASNPSSPSVDTEYSPGSTYDFIDIKTEDSYAYIGGWEWSEPGTGDRDYGVFIYDMTTTPNPTLVGFANGFDGPLGYEVVDQTLFVAEDGLHIYDISTPSTPSLLNAGNIPGAGGELTVSGNRAYANALSKRIYDISDYTNPSLEYRISSDAMPDNVIPNFDTQESIIFEDMIYFVGGGGIASIDINECNRLCPVDFNNDGNANYFDVSLFISLYAAQDTTADLNADGNLNFNDVNAFVDIYSNDCP
ncbi:MAG: LVIVD repeat-containing protein [Phycisphaerales bacterium]